MSEDPERTLLTRLEEQQAITRLMLISVGEHARARGEAEGRLRMSEMAGIVEGWRDRALAAEERLRQVESSWDAPLAAVEQIWTDPERCSGRPCLVGTRFPVAQVLAEIADTGAPGEIADRFRLDPDMLSALLRSLAETVDALGRSEARPVGGTVPALSQALREARLWHESADKALSKSATSRACSWDRLQHQEQIEAINGALTAAGQPVDWPVEES